MEATSPTSARRLGAKGLAVACASCAFGLALMILLFGLGSNPQGDSANEKKNPQAKEAPKKSQPAWNVALGNVVVVAPELGFEVKTPKNVKTELSRLNGKIEAQLLAVRDLYRVESGKNENLMGGLFLQITLGPRGTVANVNELGWRITDGDFRKAVVAEVAKWDFQDTLPEGTTINCPLLFVREGMEITTLIRWEKTLGLFEERSAVSDVGNRQGDEAKPTPTAAVSSHRPKKAAAGATRPSKPSRIANDSEDVSGLESF